MSEHSPIDFYFDFSSPYGYFAAARLDQVVAPYDRTVIWHAILLGPVFKKTGSLPLTSQPVKDGYSKHDWARLARFMDLPWSMPERFPVSTVRTARAFYAIDDADLAKVFALAAYKAYFGEGRDINDTAVIGEIASACGIDGGALCQAIEMPEIKHRLRSEVDQSMERGVFGSPFVIIDGEQFWGSDRFWMIKRWLKSGGW